MKRITLPLICATVAVFAGCSKSEAPKPAAAEAPASTPPPAPVPATAVPVAPSQTDSKKVATAGTTAAGVGAQLSQALGGDSTDLNKALKEALQVAGTRAVDELAGPNGFQKNLIPLPASVEKTRPMLKAAGKEDLLNNFSTAINSAAANAVKQSPAILNSTVQSMQLSDVTELWAGQSDAFTRYLEKHARGAIVEKMMPNIKSATDASGATQSFKQISSFLGEKTGGLMAGLQAATGVEMPNANFNLDNYVADQTMNSLFNTMAGEEKKLRENPAARSTQLLKSVFSRFEKH